VPNAIPPSLALLAASLLAFAPASAEPAARPLFYRVPDDLLKNGSFEQNWFNHNFADRRRFLLLQASDMGMGESDGKVDHWTLKGKGPVWDAEVARTGSRSLRIDGAGSALQLVRFAGENSPKAGGAFYAYFMPMEKWLAWQVLRRPIVVGAWCKTQDVPPGAEPKVSLKVECGARQAFAETKNQVTFGQKIVERSAIAAAGTHDWQYVEIRVEAAELEPAPWFATVTVSSGGKGTVWFDDLSCAEPASPGLPVKQPSLDVATAAEPAPVELRNLVSNGGFEYDDAKGWAKGWKQLALWTWFRNEYYAFTGWSHFNSKTFRGTAVIDRLLPFSGVAALRLNVFPGDNFAVESEPIVLNQKSAHPIEVRAMVKTDNLRTLEIMARDQGGAWLRQGDFLGDGMQEPGAYNMASTGAGTSDWVCVCKFFSPERPVQSLTLALAVRGFDGKLVADKNIVGTVWIDDVRLFEHSATQKKFAAAETPEAPSTTPFNVVDLDLGERLWGANEASLAVEFHGSTLDLVKRTSLELKLTDPRGGVTSSKGRLEITNAGTGPHGMGAGIWRAGYDIKSLCVNAQEQYSLTLQFRRDGEAAGAPAQYFFGTPSAMMTAGLSGYYFHADEKPLAFANLHIARASLKDFVCRFVVRNGASEKVLLEQEDLSGIGAPQTAPDYINTRNMLQTALSSEAFTVHPASDPQCDNEFKARLVLKAGDRSEAVAESERVEFGFMAELRKTEPVKIERTAVNDKGFITINGQPYFPVYWRPHGSSKSPESNYPVKDLGYKSLDVTSIVLGRNVPPDAETKAALLAKVEEVKNDPAFFQYEIGQGEMQLQGKGWQEHRDWCATAIGWIREADPNHLIDGPGSWLVGHPNHDEAMKAFVGKWDAIGVELSFESPVLINQIAKPLMTAHNTAVLVALEAYFYQPLETLRWRGYRAVIEGANGIGLCPSGMLESRPDKVNALRGLNAEFRALAPAIMGDEPAAKCTVDSDRIDMMERVAEGRRYLIAARNK
jgi:hypothetical protein